MQRIVSSGFLALVLAGVGALAPEQATAEAGDRASCQDAVSQLRGFIADGEAAPEGDHELLGGLSAEEAGEPRENWFGSPPQKEALLEKLDEASRLSEEGDTDSCIAMVEEVRDALLESGPPKPDGDQG